MPEHDDGRPLRAIQITAAVAAATFLLAGCACDDFWDGDMTTELVAAELNPAAKCNPGDLKGLSKDAAEYAGRADPRILATSRRDAERECRRAASIGRPPTSNIK